VHDDRRHFFRIMLRFPVECRRLTADGVVSSAFAAETVDLSAGGIRVVTDQSLGLRDRLRLEMRFGRPDYVLDAEASVVRVETARDGRSICGLHFDGLDQLAEQRVVQAVFAEEQRAADHHARVRISLWMPVLCHLPALGDTVHARTVDLSADDVRLVTRTPLSIGDRVEIELNSSENEFRLATDATVRMVEADGEGRFISTLRFEQLDRKTRASIVRFALDQERQDAGRRRIQGA
jgi:c-di-GMP-binding flagellar brake protein YcgR